MNFDIYARINAIRVALQITLITIFGIIIPGVLILGTCDGDKKMAIIAIIWILIEAFIIGGLKP